MCTAVENAKLDTVVKMYLVQFPNGAGLQDKFNGSNAWCKVTVLDLNECGLREGGGQAIADVLRLMRDMTGIGGDVDDSRHGGVTFFSAAAPNDHLVRRTDVCKADFQEEAKRLRRLPLCGVVGHKKLPEGSETMLMNTKLILTPKTKANLETICEVIHDPSPLLIEGETGVGKSATIDAAAILTNNKLLQFNMSSRVTIEDFLGKVELTVNEKLGFTQQPFTNAFENG
jgi:hypothetical protein